MQWPWGVVFLARHGQTQWNTQGRRQGQLDSALTEAGLAQAEAQAGKLVDLGVDAVFASPLGRALRTAEVMAELLAVPLVVVEDLAEVHHGAFAGLTDADIERDHPGVLSARAKDRFFWRFPDGESYSDAARRAERALTAIAQHGYRKPACVAHEMINRMLCGALLGESPRKALERNHPHGVVYRVDVATSSLTAL